METLATPKITPRTDDALAFAHAHQVLLLRHDPTGTPLEVSLAWLPFEMDALVYKAIAWRDRDRGDIERLLLRHREEVNLTRVRALVEEFGAAMDEPDRLRDFDALARRTLGDT